jgi:hypothetical protein
MPAENPTPSEATQFWTPQPKSEEPVLEGPFFMPYLAAVNDNPETGDDPTPAAAEPIEPDDDELYTAKKDLKYFRSVLHFWAARTARLAKAQARFVVRVVTAPMRWFKKDADPAAAPQSAPAAAPLRMLIGVPADIPLAGGNGDGGDGPGDPELKPESMPEPDKHGWLRTVAEKTVGNVVLVIAVVAGFFAKLLLIIFKAIAVIVTAAIVAVVAFQSIAAHRQPGRHQAP